jgi:hypothetical protein
VIRALRSSCALASRNGLLCCHPHPRWVPSCRAQATGCAAPPESGAHAEAGYCLPCRAAVRADASAAQCVDAAVGLAAGWLRMPAAAGSRGGHAALAACERAFSETESVLQPASGAHVRMRLCFSGRPLRLWSPQPSVCVASLPGWPGPPLSPRLQQRCQHAVPRPLSLFYLQLKRLGASAEQVLPVLDSLLFAVRSCGGTPCLVGGTCLHQRVGRRPPPRSLRRPTLPTRLPSLASSPAECLPSGT